MKENLIYESEKSKIYLTEENEWNRPVVMKILNYEFPTPNDIAQFYNEFDIIEGFEWKGVRNVLKRGREKNRHALFLEWFKSVTFKEAFQKKQEDVIDFLYIATAIVDALAEIHQHNIIHKDISPFNILVNLQQRAVKVIDFGISTRIDLKNTFLGNPEKLEGTLAYNSPEQTGRMNRIVDYRTDLYSLGITFYEALAGRLPFESNDAMELVHAHIALVPEPIGKFNRNVPPILGEIIAKLLSKNAEDRYQSAVGLKYDLEVCLTSFEKSATCPDFELATRDHSGKFLITQKLYGRETEINKLFDTYADLISTETSRLVLISGYSGTGKSVLAREIHKPITKNRGYYIEGKFDQLQRSVPYYAILQAFSDLMNIMLTENEETLSRISAELSRALGEEGKVLTDVIPQLQHIIGVQPDVAEVGGAEAQNRFKYLFRKFVKVLATQQHPLVMFIDDLQWADSSSLSLLEALLTDKESKYLLCIGAYRDNEVSASHPFIISVGEMEKDGLKIERISIGNLSEDNINELIEDSTRAIGNQQSAIGFQPTSGLKADSRLLIALTNLVYKKTSGNAFFVNQFLKLLSQEKLIWFDFKTLEWKWDIDKIKEKNITDNVVELMASKVLMLPEETQALLKTGACIGSVFSYDLLVMSSNSEGIKELKSDRMNGSDRPLYINSLIPSLLNPALSEGLIIPLNNSYKFSHDRVQQAVYSLIPTEEKKHMHLRIGKLLLQNIPPEKRNENLFEITNQWNSGIELVISDDEKEQLAKLNLAAGRKAKQSSAFKTALDYLEIGNSLIKPDGWVSQYALCRDLKTEATEAAYLCGDFVTMEKYYHQVLDNVRDLMEKVKPFEIRILAYKAENKLLDAIKTGLELLKLLGEDFPKKPTMVHVMADLVKTKIKLSGKNNEKLSALPDMTDERKLAAMRIIADITSSSYWSTPTLFPLLIFRMVHMSLRYGNTALSAFAFATYGVIMCGILGQMRNGYEFGKLGLILLDKYTSKEWKAQVYTPIYALINIWNEHVHNTLRPLQESFHIGLETGLIEFACINTNIYCIHAYLSGKPLLRLEEETKAFSESFNRFNQETNFNYNEVYRQPMLNFMGRSENPLVLTGEAYNEEKMKLQNKERNDKTGAFFIHFNKLILSYYFHDFENAKFQADESRKLLEAVLAKLEIPNHHFYEALTLLQLSAIGNQPLRGLKADIRQPIVDSRKLRAVKSNMRKLKNWAKYAPENFQHKYDLIHAELLRVTGKHNEARLIYDKAISGASLNKYIHEEALANELAGRYYIERNSEELAEFYLKASYTTYREWGAEAKLRHMEQIYPRYVSGVNRSDGNIKESGKVSNTSSMINGKVLDMTTVLKAANIISGEVVFSKLLTLLMGIVIENAGAQKGVLLLEENGNLYIEAIKDLQDQTLSILSHLTPESVDLVAPSIIAYVRRTHENVVINNAASDTRYQKDSYILKHNSKSIMCIPIINQGRFIGLFYLENNLSTGAFTQERINLLSLLSGQIATSIENAMLYESLGKKVEERTAELAKEKKKSDDLLENILPVEIAEELKLNGHTRPKSFENVTVLFTDFVGFTLVSSKMSPEELVTTIDTCFSAFDNMLKKYKVEKIKTIGDAYMCVGGLPIPNSTHATDTLQVALEIRDWVKEFNKKREEENKPLFNIRIGLHTGPVVAGVVGSKKFAYDIWGDTVNTASRMESGSELGKINISETTYKLVADKFQCIYRGKLLAKNKGEIDMYFAENKL